MCVVSFVGDQFQKQWTPWQRYIAPAATTPGVNPTPIIEGPSKADFDRLRNEVELLKNMLAGAKEYDRKNNEPGCEIEEKMDFLRKVAALVHEDLDVVLKPKSKPGFIEGSKS